MKNIILPVYLNGSFTGSWTHTLKGPAWLDTSRLRLDGDGTRWRVAIEDSNGQPVSYGLAARTYGDALNAYVAPGIARQLGKLA